MNRILINSCFLLFILNIYGQKIEKKSIYLEFKLDTNCPRNMKFYKEDESGIVFNIFCETGGSFLWQNKSDTLSICKLKNYNTISFEEVEKLEKQWRIDNKKAMIKKFGKIYPRYNKNGIFKTYLIEVINALEFVVYSVEWRHLETVE
ncbi:hypothetical protein HNP99_003564 [Flavobacterium sp. 28A]|uniref:hypothetical protein n=1 Tax=Flavobacterium sp. 28A TaxID=2735895 RepID=UPI00156DA4AC|nr:hypothetical protein [Flavobacterium sp. 28A]NRT17185.1 hypothetical protein [Flavobacterium sp. 28A]